MRTVTALALVLLLLSGTNVFAQLTANKLEGSWRMIRQTLVYPDTTIVRNQVPPSTKILNSTHFSWGYQTDDGEDVLAGGGRYTLYGDTLYIEHLEYHTSPPLVGMDLKFEARVEGDSLWYHTGRIGDFVLKEVWRRLH